MNARQLAVCVFLATILLLASSTAQPTFVQAQPLSRASSDSSSNPSRVSAALRSAPVMFIENAGQFGDGARFQVRGGNGTIWLADDAIWITVLERSAVRRQPSAVSDQWPAISNRQSAIENRKGVNLKLSFVGANPRPRLEPFNRLDTHVSYFIRNDPAKWRPDVPVWGGVRYKDLYPGIDLEITGENGQVVQRIVTRAGANLNTVRLRVDGADKIALDGDRLRLTTAVGEYTLPLLRTTGAGNAKLPRPTVAGNQVTAPFTQATISNQQSAIRNPQSSDLLYATFLGGSGSDWGYGIAVDASGAAYVTGYTYSSNFPTTPGAFDTNFNSDDAFVVKLNPAGSALTYATFLGGYSWDEGVGIAVDASGAAYVTGYTYSSDFPTTPGVFDTSHNGYCDAFVVKLNATGSALAYATFLGGGGYDYGSSIAVDTSGAAYVTGRTQSSNFPTTPGAFDTSFNGGDDTFVAKLNTTGSALTYATFLGGSSVDRGKGIAVDTSGAAYVTGRTQSSNFPTTPGAFDTTHNGDNDVFVVKLNATGSALIYATFLGRSNHDDGQAIAVDTSGAAYVTGVTSSSDFPTTPGAFDTSYNGGNYDAFVVKLNESGSALAYATFLGGSSDDLGYRIAVDASGVAYVTGYTLSSDFPTTPGAFNTSFNGGDSDAFVVKLNTAGSALTYATFLGGSSVDLGYGIAADASGAAYVTGWTESSNFPTTPGAFDTSYNGNDAFVVKLGMRITGVIPFLDLPIAYSNFAEAAQGNVGGRGPGRVNSWFDHQYPTYNNPPNNQYPGLKRWDGQFFPNPTQIGEGWYDGHNGIDFQSRSTTEQVFASATGTVLNTATNPLVTTCQEGDQTCGNGYGNQVWINHGNKYATLYGHLKTVLVSSGTPIINPGSQPLGIMGNTGRSTGTHLHFGLYYDKNNDGRWTEDEVVDPFGWSGSGADPWSVTSQYLWKYPIQVQQTAGSSGTSLTSPSGKVNTVIPSGALTTTVTVELWDTPPVANPSAQLRSTGKSFLLRVLEWLIGGSGANVRATTTAGSFAQPVTVTVTYGVTETLHLNTSQLTIYRWNDTTSTWVALPTTVDTVQKQATAQTTEIGNFDLQAPLLCPSDTAEPDDTYYVATSITLDGTWLSSLFDSASDEDWFKLNAVAGYTYRFQTGNLASGVDTVLQIYDLDGVTLLASDDNSNGGKASRLVWQAPRSGTYFLRVSQAAGSAYGCSATYQLSANQSHNIFLPLIVR